MYKNLILILISLFILNTVLFSLEIYFLESKDFQIYSVVAQSISVIIISLFLNKRLNLKINTRYLLNDTSYFIAFSIILLNAFLGIFNLIYILDYINFEKYDYNFNVKDFILYSSSGSIIFSQIGGFFLQLFLIHFLSVVLDIVIKVKEIFLILGTAYLGFFLSSLILFFFNLINIDDFNNVNDFVTEMSISRTRIIIGKIGEYLTLVIAIFMLIRYKRFPIIKSILLIYIPNILLMSILLLFQNLI